MSRSSVLLALIFAGCGGSTANVPHTRMTAKDIVKEASPSVVRVEAGLNKLGTGFVVDRAGLVATNMHVVAGESDIKVRLNDGTLYPVLQIANVDPAHDLALLRIRPTRPLPSLRIGDSESLGAGDQVYAIGNPLGVLDNSVSNGLVSSVRVLCTDHDVSARATLLAKIGRPADEIRQELGSKATRSRDEEDMLRVLGCSQELTILQISAPISLGSSGGPLFNQFGEVVGVTTAIITSGQNLNIAMPAKYLKPLVKQQPAPMALDTFAQLTKEEPEDGRPHADSDTDTTPPARQVPNLPITVWDGCKQHDIEETVVAIDEAIRIGAPAYNKMTPEGFEECFRVYEGTALKLEQSGACKGVQATFGDGLLRASALKSFKDKAWAMRDTFDGLKDAAGRWCAHDAKCRRNPP